MESQASKIWAVRIVQWLALLWLVLSGGQAKAHDPQDLMLEKVGVEEHLGAGIPLDLTFTDQQGRAVRLGDYVKAMPVLLTLNYYGCPTLCPLVFRNMVQTLKGMKDLSLGRDFRIVTVSINPNESLALAQDKSRTTYGMLEGAAPEKNWPFLMGEHLAIERLTRSVGVRYARIATAEFAHPNVIIIVTPQGKISRYLYGIEQQPNDLRLALIEASDGRIGRSQLLNRALLYCFHYDPIGKKYVLVASRIMTGTMTALFAALVILLVSLWKKESKSRKKS